MKTPLNPDCGGTSGCRTAQGPERPGQATVVRWKRLRVSRLSLQLQNPHEPRQSCLSHVDGQVRNRAESSLPDSSESAWRCTPEVLYTDVLFTGRDNETQCPNSCPINGTEAWRLMHGRYAPDTQNRQCALMQQIMMPAKLWCDHAEGFESGLRAWELDVGEWERASGTALADAVKDTVTMNMAPIFLRNSLQLGTHPNSAALRAALLQWCYSSRNFGANLTVSAGNVTSADDDRMPVDSLKKGKEKGKGKPHNQKGNRTTSATNTSSTDIKHVQELWQNKILGEGLLDTRWRSVRQSHQ